jgi:hypothetical protein
MSFVSKLRRVRLQALAIGSIVASGAIAAWPTDAWASHESNYCLADYTYGWCCACIEGVYRQCFAQAEVGLTECWGGPGWGGWCPFDNCYF